MAKGNTNHADVQTNLKLFMTATPRVLKPKVKSALTESLDFYSMDDVDDYGMNYIITHSEMP